jgi:hypothetical protein
VSTARSAPTSDLKIFKDPRRKSRFASIAGYFGFFCIPHNESFEIKERENKKLNKSFLFKWP